MIADPPSLIRKSALSLAVAILVAFSGRGNADEPIYSTNSVKKSESTASEIQNQSSRFFRAYRPGETISGPNIFSPRAPGVVPRQGPPPSSSKRDDDRLDRQRNWIFLSRDEKKPDPTKEAFGVEDSSLEGRKSVVTRYLENKPASDLKTNLGEKNELNPSLNSQPLTSGLNSSVNNEMQNDPRRTGSLQPQPLERNLTGSAAERAKFSDLWRERLVGNQNQAREEKEAESKAFLNLFASRNSAPSSSGITALSGQNNFGVQLVTPGERGSDRPSNPNAFTSSLDPFREAPRLPVGGSSILTEPTFSSRVFGPAPAPVLKQDAAKSVAQPAVLPFPKRHF